MALKVWQITSQPQNRSQSFWYKLNVTVLANMSLHSLHNVDHLISDEGLIIPLCVLCSWYWPTVLNQLYIIMSHHICMQYNMCDVFVIQSSYIC